jgi:hypothetical protein
MSTQENKTISLFLKKISGKSPFKILTTTMLTATACALGCVSSLQSESLDEGSGVFSLNHSQGQRVVEITDFKSAEAYAKKMGFYSDAKCNSYLKGGEQVWYSGSYGEEGEAGQAYGSLVKKNIAGRDTFWFVQKGITTTQGMFPPGLSTFSGESRWELGRYQRILADIAFGRESNPGSRYSSISGEVVGQLSGGTAGGQVTYGNALKLTLSNSQTGTQTVIIFVKDQGPRIMEFRESSRFGVGGTAKVYIGSSGA